MADKSLREYLVDVADAIRSKTSTQDKMTIQEMPEKIESISGGGADPAAVAAFANKLVTIDLGNAIYNVATKYYNLDSAVDIADAAIIGLAHDHQIKPSFKFTCDNQTYIVTNYTSVDENGISNLMSIHPDSISATETKEFDSLTIEPGEKDPQLVLTPYGKRWDEGLALTAWGKEMEVQLNNNDPIALGPSLNCLKLCNSDKYIWEEGEVLNNGLYFDGRGFFLIHDDENLPVVLGNDGKFYYQNEDSTQGEEVPLEYIYWAMTEYIFNPLEYGFRCMWNISIK